MFGVLRVEGKRLRYDFYVAESGGGATLYDTFGIQKESGSAGVSNAVDFSQLPAGTAELDPLANDAGEADASVTNRYWSYSGATAAGLAIGTQGVSGDGRCLNLATGNGILFRNFAPLTPMDALTADAGEVEIPAAGSLDYETHVVFRRSNVLPTRAEVVASDKLVLGVYGDSRRTGLYAFAGYQGTSGLEMRAFRLGIDVTDAWLAARHHVRVKAFAGATADGGTGLTVEIDGRRLSVAAVSRISGGELEEEVAAMAVSYLGTVQ